MKQEGDVRVAYNAQNALYRALGRKREINIHEACFSPAPGWKDAGNTEEIERHVPLAQRNNITGSKEQLIRNMESSH